MSVSYKKLWKLLIDKDMKKKDLCEKAGISPASVTKMGRNGHVTTEILVKICAALDCRIEDRELIKSAKLDFLMDNEPFSKAIILNRNVRNAIAHFNYDFDSDSQRIIFSDKHKGRENAVELYLIDLAILCYENISVLTYLNELLYTLRKIEYVSEGMCIHIKRS